MLFVDDGQAERFELHLFFEESVRADGELDVALAQSGGESAAFASAHRAGGFGHDDGRGRQAARLSLRERASALVLHGKTIVK